MNTINVRALGLASVESNVWYSFTQPQSKERICITKAEGIMLTDINGKSYYDSVSGLWNTPLGYGVPSIKEAVVKQFEELQYCSLFEHTMPIAEEAANILLSNTAPVMKKVIWGCTGSESIECAIKLMRSYQKSAGYVERTIILSLTESYHGTHYGAISVSGLEGNAAQFISPILPGIMFLSPAYEFELAEEIETKIEASLDMIENNQDRIAGVVIEPVLASAGVKVVSQQYLRRLCECCFKYDILVTFDEVTTGFYRTGSLFYCHSLGITPDILCLSKAINNGCLPLSATIVCDKICLRFQENASVLQHGTTQGGNPSALAALIATDREFELLTQRDDLLAKAEEFLTVLSSAVQRHDYVEQVRSKGFMYSVVLNRERFAGTRDIATVTDKIRHMGVLVYRAESGFTLMPCLCTEMAQWKIITGIIDIALGQFS